VDSAVLILAYLGAGAGRFNDGDLHDNALHVREGAGHGCHTLLLALV
jgi:hypothetical protein